MAQHSHIPWHLCAQQLVETSSETVITGGFPCQDISYAGEGAGFAGARSGLVWPLLRTIRLVRPRFAVLENVAALLTRGLDVVLGRLAAIGYDTEWHCIPASAVGAPHQRDRIWLIAADANSEQYQSDCAPFSGTLADELSRANSDADSERQLQSEGSEPDQQRWLGHMGAEMADAGCSGLEGPGDVEGSAGEPGSGQSMFRSPSDGRQWHIEPAVGRVADGVPFRVDRIRTLGNAVVPQIPEIIARAIKARAHLTSGQRT